MSVFRRARERRGTPADVLVVGLGNPGARYVNTRHNIGFDAVEELAGRHGIQLRSSRGERARVGTGSIGGQRVALACPDTFMNLSGESVRLLVTRHGIDDPAGVIVVYDDMDLEPGRIRVRAGGGSGGHKGMRSISAHLSTQGFPRVRIGVGRPPRAGAGADWVLKPMSKADRQLFDTAASAAADAVDTFVSGGLEAAMNLHNAR